MALWCTGAGKAPAPVCWSEEVQTQEKGPHQSWVEEPEEKPKASKPPVQSPKG